MTTTGKATGGTADGIGGGSRRRALSAPHSAPAGEFSIWENGIILPGATRECARAEGMRFPDALISNLKAARVGPARAALCAVRQAEARDALREAEAILAAAEEAIDKGEGFAPLVPGLRETHWLCSGLCHALEILEANSRACGEGMQVMAEYPPLIVQAGSCEWRLTKLAERWRETEGKEFTFGKIMSLVASPFSAVLQNLMPNVGLVSEPHSRTRTYEDEACSSSGRPLSEGDADAGAGGSGSRRSARRSGELEKPPGAWTFWGPAAWGDTGGSMPSSAEFSAEETTKDHPPAKSSFRDTDIKPSHRAQEEQALPSTPSRTKDLEADLVNKLMLEMEHKAMQAEDSAARSQQMHEALIRQLAVAKGLQGSQHGQPEASGSDDEEFFDPGDE